MPVAQKKSSAVERDRSAPESFPDRDRDTFARLEDFSQERQRRERETSESADSEHEDSVHTRAKSVIESIKDPVSKVWKSLKETAQSTTAAIKETWKEMSAGERRGTALLSVFGLTLFFVGRSYFKNRKSTDGSSPENGKSWWDRLKDWFKNPLGLNALDEKFKKFAKWAGLLSAGGVVALWSGLHAEMSGLSVDEKKKQIDDIVEGIANFSGLDGAAKEVVRKGLYTFAGIGVLGELPERLSKEFAEWHTKLVAHCEKWGIPLADVETWMHEQFGGIEGIYKDFCKEHPAMSGIGKGTLTTVLAWWFLKKGGPALVLGVGKKSFGLMFGSKLRTGISLVALTGLIGFFVSTPEDCKKALECFKDVFDIKKAYHFFLPSKEVVSYEDKEPMIHSLETVLAEVQKIKFLPEEDLQKNLQVQLIAEIKKILKKLADLEPGKEEKIDFHVLTYLAIKINLPDTSCVSHGEGENTLYTLTLGSVEFPELQENPEGTTMETVYIGVLDRLKHWDQILADHGFKGQKKPAWLEKLASKEEFEKLFQGDFKEKMLEYGPTVAGAIALSVLLFKCLENKIGDKFQLLGSALSLVAMEQGGEMILNGVDATLDLNLLSQLNDSLKEIGGEISGMFSDWEAEGVDMKDVVGKYFPKKVLAYFDRFGFDFPDTYISGQTAETLLGQVRSLRPMSQWDPEMRETLQKLEKQLYQGTIGGQVSEWLKDRSSRDPETTQVCKAIQDVTINTVSALELLKYIASLRQGKNLNPETEKMLVELEKFIHEHAAVQQKINAAYYGDHIAYIARIAKEKGYEVKVEEAAHNTFTVYIGSVVLSNLPQNPLGPEYITRKEIGDEISLLNLHGLHFLHERLQFLTADRVANIKDEGQKERLRALEKLLAENSDFMKRITDNGFHRLDMEMLKRKCIQAGISWEPRGYELQVLLPGGFDGFSIGINPECTQAEYLKLRETYGKTWPSGFLGATGKSGHEAGAAAADLVLKTNQVPLLHLLKLAPPGSDMEKTLRHFIMAPEACFDAVWLARLMGSIWAVGGYMRILTGGIIFTIGSAEVAWNGIADIISGQPFRAAWAYWTGKEDLNEAFYRCRGMITLYATPLATAGVGAAIGTGVGAYNGKAWEGTKKGFRIGYKTGKVVVWVPQQMVKGLWRLPRFTYHVWQHPKAWLERKWSLRKTPGLVISSNWWFGREKKGRLDAIRDRYVEIEKTKALYQKAITKTAANPPDPLSGRYPSPEDLNELVDKQAAAEGNKATNTEGQSLNRKWAEDKVKKLTHKQEALVKKYHEIIGASQIQEHEVEKLLIEAANENEIVEKYRAMEVKTIAEGIAESELGKKIVAPVKETAGEMGRKTVELAKRRWDAHSESGMKVLAAYQVVMSVKSVVDIENAKKEIAKRRAEIPKMNIPEIDKQQMNAAFDDELELLKWQEYIVGGNTFTGVGVLAPDALQALGRLGKNTLKFQALVQKAGPYAEKLGKFAGPFMLVMMCVEAGYYNFVEIPHLKESLNEMINTLPVLIEAGQISPQQGKESLELLKAQLERIGEKRWAKNIETALAATTLLMGAALGVAAMTAAAPVLYMFHTAEKSRDREIRSLDQWIQNPKDVLINELLSTAADQNASEAYRVAGRIWKKSAVEEDIDTKKKATRRRIIEAILIKENESPERACLRRNFIRLRAGDSYFFENYSVLERTLEDSKIFADAAQSTGEMNFEAIPVPPIGNALLQEALISLKTANTRNYVLNLLKNPDIESALHEKPEAKIQAFCTVLLKTYKGSLGRTKIDAPEATDPRKFSSPLHYGLYNLAISLGFPKGADTSLEILKKFFNENQKTQRGIYWDGTTWYIHNVADLTDKKIGDDENTLEKMIDYLQGHKTVILEPTYGSFADNGPFSFAHQALATKVESMIEHLETGRRFSEKMAA